MTMVEPHTCNKLQSKLSPEQSLSLNQGQNLTTEHDLACRSTTAKEMSACYILPVGYKIQNYDSLHAVNSL